MQPSEYEIFSSRASVDTSFFFLLALCKANIHICNVILSLPVKETIHSHITTSSFSWTVLKNTNIEKRLYFLSKNNCQPKVYYYPISF